MVHWLENTEPRELVTGSRVCLKLGDRYNTAFAYSEFTGNHSKTRVKCSNHYTCQAFSHKPTCPAFSPITFNSNTKKRLRSAIDNFTTIFKSCYAIDESLLFYTHKKKVHKRKPVFLTLTIPEQSINDYHIKARLLNNFLKAITRFKGCKMYIWKSEAQERGDIHFHLIIDCFIFEREARKIWYRLLKANLQIKEELTESYASRICYFTTIKDIDFIGEMIGAYFETERDEEGKLKHKHKENVNVRDVEGRAWGCSDNLKFAGLTFYDIPSSFTSYLQKESKGTKNVFNQSEERIATLYFNSRYVPANNNQKGYKDRSYNGFTKLLLDYNFHFAQDIYGTGNNRIEKRIGDWNKVSHLLSQEVRDLLEL